MSTTPDAAPDIRPPLTALQAAARLNVSRATVYNLVRAGTLKHLRFSPSCIRIPVSEIERLLTLGASHAGR